MVIGLNRLNYRVKVFDLQAPGDVAELEEIKRRCLLDKAPGYTIMSQREFSNKDGDVFVLLEWTEAVGG